jgi:hypothetical protein
MANEYTTRVKEIEKTIMSKNESIMKLNSTVSQLK